MSSSSCARRMYGPSPAIANRRRPQLAALPVESLRPVHVPAPPARCAQQPCVRRTAAARSRRPHARYVRQPQVGSRWPHARYVRQPQVGSRWPHARYVRQPQVGSRWPHARYVRQPQVGSRWPHARYVRQPQVASSTPDGYGPAADAPPGKAARRRALAAGCGWGRSLHSIALDTHSRWRVPLK